MEIAELKEKIISKQLPGFLIFTGEEVGLMDMYINQIQKVYGMDFVWLEDVKSVLVNLRFTKGISLFCVHGDTSVTKDESIWDKLKSTRGIVVLLLPKIKKNEKFYKQFSDRVVEFQRMNKQITIQLLQKLSPISTDRLEWLLNICNGDYLRARNELYKVSVCNGDNSLFDLFASKGIFHQDIPDVTFQFKDAVLKRDRINSFSLLNMMQLAGVEPLMTLGLLYKGFRDLASFLCTKTPNPNTTGLSTGVLYYQRAYKSYKPAEVLNIMKTIFDIGEMVIRGSLNAEDCLEYMLVRVL